MLEKVYQELLELYEREHQILHGNFEGSKEVLTLEEALQELGEEEKGEENKQEEVVAMQEQEQVMQEQEQNITQEKEMQQQERDTRVYDTRAYREARGRLWMFYQKILNKLPEVEGVDLMDIVIQQYPEARGGVSESWVRRLIRACWFRYGEPDYQKYAIEFLREHGFDVSKIEVRGYRSLRSRKEDGKKHLLKALDILRKRLQEIERERERIKTEIERIEAVLELEGVYVER
ncbi:hypothetical protein [Hydrogenobacter thermophilus]|uniref:hypothetical protein n=1 Tax=Hydrogenobacter thermophilus TaxID=940 RepID=UPI0030F94D8C